MIGKVWERTHFRRGTKGDREPPVGLRWKQWSLVRGPGCECDHITSHDDRMAENLFGTPPGVPRSFLSGSDE